MPRFAILHHDWPKVHWDFFLEAGDSLRGWRLLSEPSRGQEIVAEPLPNHRLIYLDYEGPLSGDRGSVSRWDAGTFAWECNEADGVRVRMDGQRLKGEVVLRANGKDEWKWTWIA